MHRSSPLLRTGMHRSSPLLRTGMHRSSPLLRTGMHRSRPLLRTGMHRSSPLLRTGMHRSRPLLRTGINRSTNMVLKFHSMYSTPSPGGMWGGGDYLKLTITLSGKKQSWFLYVLVMINLLLATTQISHLLQSRVYSNFISAQCSITQ